MKNLITQMQALLIDALIQGNYTILAMPTNDRLSIDIDGLSISIHRFKEWKTISFSVADVYFAPNLTRDQEQQAYTASTEKYEAYRKAHRKLQIEEQQIALDNELKTL